MIVAPQGGWRVRHRNSAIADVLGSPCGARNAACTVLLHSKNPVVANPSYAAYTWSPIGADVPIPGTSRRGRHDPSRNDRHRGRRQRAAVWNHRQRQLCRDRQRMIVSAVSDNPLTVDAPNTVQAKAGERVGLSIAPQAVRLLPLEG